TFECTKSGNENNSTFGSLIGQVKGTGTANALYINNCNVKSAFNNNNTSYHGGLIGMVGGNRQDNAIYVEVNGGTAADSKIHVEVTNPLATGKFGGMIGCLSKGSILKMTGIVEISTTAHISQGGGIVGHAAEGSAVEFNGTTDLSEVKYAWDKTNEGQLIGRQESSLIYARGDGNGNGWKFIRTNAANNTNKELNDIGNYGEVIRLQADSNPAAGLDKELIKINAEHQIELKQAADYTGNSNYGGDITLASREGLALLAITLQTRGYFSADKTYIPANSWTELTKKNISLSADIDLTGTGILGIERDSENNTTAYTGTFYGNGKKITLAIGEQYGFRNNTLVQSGDWGSGQIYTNNEHENLGLFSLVSGNVSNLTIDGIIQVNSTYAWGDAGGYAGQLRGNSEIVNVTTAQSMNIKSSSVTKVGALFGENIGTSNIILTNFESRTVINIDSSDSALDCVGSLAGVYRDNTRDRTISCNDVLIGTKISTTGRNIHAGGLIGEIPTSNNKRKINISKIQINGFEINNKAENSYQKLQTCGGVLGYLWENTDVVFHTPADADAYA
ncbi:MAG: hypothetical protein ACOCNL_16880, partial [Acetivibrio ethanolgignens]